LDTLFLHENQAYPPSLSQFGKLNFGVKSDLLSCLEKMSPTTHGTPVADVVLVDGAVIANMIKPGTAKTFEEYAQQSFLPYVMHQLQNVKRLDIIWDEYVPDSLQSMTRSERGKGIRRRVKSDTRLPGNWP
jgi:hypothetical protein